MDELNWSNVLILVGVALFAGLIGYAISPEKTGLTNAEVDAKVSEAVNQSIFQKNSEIERLRGLITELGREDVGDEDEDENGEVDVKAVGYLIDELFLSTPLEDIYSDREIKNLFDGEVNFDGKDYDAEETIKFKDIELLANENDFEGNVYMIVPEGAIEYKFAFENDLNTSLIDDEETLVFNFLGNELEISEWNEDSLVFFQGEAYTLDEGDSVTVGNQVITLEFVNDDSVYIIVDDDSRTIDEGKIRTISGLQIKLEYSFETTSYRVGQAKIIVAEDIEKEVVNGDEYEEDSPWEWVIDSNSLGLVLKEDFTERDKDGDEDFPAVGINEKICLPNEYKCFIFNGMDEVDTEDYFLELDEKSGNEYVRIKGNFISGIEDYNRIYVNATGIYDRDLELIDKDEIELGDTDSILDISSGKLVFEDFEVNFDLNVTNVGSDEEDFLTDYGVLVINPEDSIDDFEWTVEVPESKLEGSITLI